MRRFLSQHCMHLRHGRIDLIYIVWVVVVVVVSAASLRCVDRGNTRFQMSPLPYNASSTYAVYARVHLTHCSYILHTVYASRTTAHLHSMVVGRRPAAYRHLLCICLGPLVEGMPLHACTRSSPRPMHDEDL